MKVGRKHRHPDAESAEHHGLGSFGDQAHGVAIDLFRTLDPQEAVFQAESDLWVGHEVEGINDVVRIELGAIVEGDVLAQLELPTCRAGLFPRCCEMGQNFAGGQVDITSGKFVFSSSEAYLIENGKITTPVKGATLIGNGPDVLTKVSMVGNDLELDSGVGTCGKEGQSVPVGVGQPTLKIDGLTVGGTHA